MTKLDLNDLAHQIHQQNVDLGWWDEPREAGTLLMLVVSEIAEAMEGERKDKMDDHLTHRKMAEVELADAVIRLLDIAVFYKINHIKFDAERQYLVHWGLDKFGTEKGSQLLAIDFNIIKTYLYVRDCDPFAAKKISNVINMIYHYASLYNHDIDSAMLEKIEYNRTRPDHKKENRLATGGKKF